MIFCIVYALIVNDKLINSSKSFGISILVKRTNCVQIFFLIPENERFSSADHKVYINKKKAKKTNNGFGGFLNWSGSNLNDSCR